jgi:integrase
MAESTLPASISKPTKPRPDFPLFPHATRRWAKKIRGKTFYFGPWDNPQGALAKYLDEKDDLFAGRTPRAKQQEGLTVRELADRFLTTKRHALDTGELSPRTFSDYFSTCKLVVRHFGPGRVVLDLRPEDFERLKRALSASWGPRRRHKFVTMTRSLLKFAYDEDLIDRPVKTGKQFKGPSKKTLRLHRAQAGLRMFEADEILRILNAAGVQLKAMTLLGLNCGFGNSDVSSLPLSALDLDRSWVSYPRPKTGVDRRCPLWPETVQAIREVLARRIVPTKSEHADLVFVTKYGDSWVKARCVPQEDGKIKVCCDDAVSKAMRKLLRKLGINGRRNFYALRHGTETIGGEAKDPVALNALMGHVDSTMSANYRERISDGRLLAVTNHIHGWLFGATTPN